MTIGEIYYLSIILSNLNLFARIAVWGLGFFFIVFAALKEEHYKKDDNIKNLKKDIRIPLIALIVSLIIILFTPSKEDFIIITMTKDYKPEQAYEITKNELKRNIDYIFKQIKKIKECKR